MAQLGKNQLELALKQVATGLDATRRNNEKKEGFYTRLYPEGLSEIDLTDAISFEDLHPLMVQVVEKIIELVGCGKTGPIWIDEENQAGRYLTHALALHDKKYCALFADCLLCQDLAHEVHQNDDIRDILGAWGLCDETALILNARQDNSGQHGEEFIAELREEYGDILDEYQGGENIISAEEVGPESNADWGVGYSLKVQDRDNHFMFLNWNQGECLLAVRYNRGDVKVLRYESPESLRQTVEAFEAYSKKLKFTWALEEDGSQGDLSEWCKPEPACDLPTLLNPRAKRLDELDV